MREIKARFVTERGHWDGEKFINRVSKTTWKTIHMELDKSAHGDIIRFLGGPTGHESYYVDDLLVKPQEEYPEFCICAGTINRWPACYVSRKEVFDFIRENT